MKSAILCFRPVAAAAAILLFPVTSPMTAVAAPVAETLILDTRNFPVVGTVHRLDPRLDELIAPGAQIEVIASGFDWCEGPVWVPEAADATNGGPLVTPVRESTAGSRARTDSLWIRPGV